MQVDFTVIIHSFIYSQERASLTADWMEKRFKLHRADDDFTNCVSLFLKFKEQFRGINGQV